MATSPVSQRSSRPRRNRSRRFDNVSNRALLRRMRENGNQTSVTGRDIVRELEYAANGTVQFYSGCEILDVSLSDVLTAGASTRSLPVTSPSAAWRKSKTRH